MPIYVQRNSQQLGPYSAAEVKSQLANGALSVTDPVWWTGEKAWVPLGESKLMKGGFKEFPGLKKEVELPAGISPAAVGSVMCAGLTLLGGPLAGIPGIVLGHMALREFKTNPKRTGKLLGVIGLVLCYIMTVVTTFLFVTFFVFSDEVRNVQLREEALRSASPPPVPSYLLKQTAPPPAPPVTNAVPATNAIAPTPPPPAAETTVAPAAPAPTPAPTAPADPDSSTNTGPVKQ